MIEPLISLMGRLRDTKSRNEFADPSLVSIAYKFEDRRTLDNAHDVVVEDGIAYAVGFTSNEIGIYDVRDCTIERLATTDEGLSSNAYNCVVDGGLLYVGSYSYSTASWDSSEQSTGRISIYDVSNPTSPELLSYVEDPRLYSVHGLSLHEDYLFTDAHRPGKVMSIDVSDTADPEVVDDLDVDSPHDSVYDDGLLYLGGNKTDEGFKIVDASDPTELSILSTLADSRIFDTRGVTKDASYAYVAICNHGNNTEGGLGVIDVGDPRDPDIRSVVRSDAMDTFHNIHPVGDGFIVGMAFDSNSVVLIDVSEPDDPLITDVLIDEAHLNRPHDGDVWRGNLFCAVEDGLTSVNVDPAKLRY